MSLTYTNSSNGSTSKLETINEQVSIKDVMTFIKDSHRKLEDKVEISDKVAFDILMGTIKENISVSDLATLEITAGLKEKIEFIENVAIHLSTVIQTELSVSDKVRIIEGYARTISDSFSLTDGVVLSIIKGIEDKVPFSEELSISLITNLSEAISAADLTKIHLTSGLEDNVLVPDTITINHIETRAIGCPRALGSYLIG
ncbi:MAG: hypothetical protein DRO67_05955 [Candidatus Asgardarchaeum californiense]|nr:MAG: hypothetical protein DRO67_05955 [Candidatus Asgardarchaeum californiense]